MSAEQAASAVRDRAYFDQRRQARARTVRRRRRLVVGGVVALAVALIAVGAGFAGSSDRIAGGVTIAGIDVGGMTRAEAESLLTERAQAAAGQPVTFVSGEERFIVVPAEAGVAADWKAVLDEAIQKGDGFFLFRGFQRLALRFGGADIVAASAASGSFVQEQLDRFAASIDQPARNASIVLDGLTPTVRPSQTGIALDRVAAARVVTVALTGFERTGPVELPVTVVQAQVREADLQEAVGQVRTALSGPVELTYRKRTFTVQPAKLATFLVLPKNGDKELALGGREFRRYLSSLAAKVDRSPENAGFAITSGGKPRVVPGREGRRLDRDATVGALLAASLATVPASRQAELTVSVAQPKVSTDEAKAMGITGVVASYTTVYGGDPNRLHNVRLVAELIDDHLIAPGATFSFNETTGERNADKGFREAPVIINGELQTGLGGGVCQVSTTVFNTAYEAGLPIGTRTNHALYISHYPTGRDATVNYPDIDLTFTNDTGHWLWLRAFVGTSELTVNLYGTPTGRVVETIETPMKVGKTIPVEKIPEPDMFVGESWVESPGQPARDVSVRRIVRDSDGNVLYDTVYYSHYIAEPKIVHVGTKKRDQDTGQPTGAEDGGSAGGTSGGGGSGGGQAGGSGSGGGSTGGGSTGGGSGGSGGGGSGGSTGGGSGGSGGGGSGGSGGGEPPPPPT